ERQVLGRPSTDAVGETAGEVTDAELAEAFRHDRLRGPSLELVEEVGQDPYVGRARRRAEVRGLHPVAVDAGRGGDVGLEQLAHELLVAQYASVDRDRCEQLARPREPDGLVGAVGQ